MEAVCFDVKAPFASFRVPSTTRGFLSFPFPPRTTIMGLIGAIMGVPKNELYLNDHFLFDAFIAVQVLRDPITINFRTNQTQTKGEFLYSNPKFGLKLYIPGKLERGVRSPQTLIILNNVIYRIYLSLNLSEKLDEFVKRIINHKYVYPPYLGRVNYLASIDFIDRISLKKLNNDNLKVKIDTVCPTDYINNIQSGQFNIIYNVPMAYNVVKDSKSNEFKISPRLLADIVYFVEPIDILIKSNSEIYIIIKSSNSQFNGRCISFLPSRSKDNKI